MVEKKKKSWFRELLESYLKKTWSEQEKEETEEEKKKKKGPRWFDLPPGERGGGAIYQ